MSSVLQNQTWDCLLYFTRTHKAVLHAEGDRSPISEVGYIGSANRETTVREWADLKQVNIYCNSERCISPFIYALLVFQNVPAPAVKECSPLRQFLLLTNITPLASWVLAVLFGTVFVRSKINALPAFSGHRSSKV